MAALIDGLMPGSLKVSTTLNGDTSIAQGSLPVGEEVYIRTIFGDVFDSTIRLCGPSKNIHFSPPSESVSPSSSRNSLAYTTLAAA